MVHATEQKTAARAALCLAAVRSLWTVLSTGCFSADRKAYLELHTGFGSTEQVLIEGRALEDAAPQTPEGERSRLGNVLRSARLLETDELSGRR